MKTLIVYWTKTGHTARAAEDIAQGMREQGAEVDLVNLRDHDAPPLEPYDILAVGSPCHAGSINHAGTGIAVPVVRFLRELQPGSLESRASGAFSVNSGLGGRRTVGSMERLLADRGARLVSPGPVVKAGVPFSLWEGPRASEQDRETLRDFGRLLATHQPA